jgi:hypothetical protein
VRRVDHHTAHGEAERPPLQRAQLGGKARGESAVAQASRRCFAARTRPAAKPPRGAGRRYGASRTPVRRSLPPHGAAYVPRGPARRAPAHPASTGPRRGGRPPAGAWMPTLQGPGLRSWRVRVAARCTLLPGGELSTEPRLPRCVRCGLDASGAGAQIPSRRRAEHRTTRAAAKVGCGMCSTS